MRHIAIAVTAVTVGLGAGCSIHTPSRNPKPPLEMADSFRSANAEAPLPEQWWKDFGDAQLDALVERALDGNFRLKGAFARIEQARAVARQAGSGKWPQINAGAGAGTSQSKFKIGDVEGETKQQTYSLSLSAAYEVDIWKRISSAHTATELDAAAARDDMEAMAMSLASEVSEAWFDLVMQRQRRALLTEQLQTNETFVELVTLRFTQGLGASAVDVFQARSQVTATRAQLALVDALETVAAYRLAALMGKTPGSIELSDTAELPSLPSLPGTGVPADLLLRRPDVRAIRRRAEAADFRVASAVADRLPKLSISAEGGYRGFALGDVFSSPFYNLAANLLGPVFDGGRRSAEVDRNRAVVDELMAAYGQTVLGALVEVDNALVLEEGQLAYIAELEALVEISTSTLAEARNRYREGITDFLPVLTALRTLHVSEEQLLGARRQLISYRIQLCRALGGTWTARLEGTAP
jgi:NodT family efflux transporter outer membrane factor (OMF) lipoprotein